MESAVEAGHRLLSRLEVVVILLNDRSKNGYRIRKYHQGKEQGQDATENARMGVPLVQVKTPCLKFAQRHRPKTAPCPCPP